MNVIQKSEAIKAGLRKGFQDGSSKMAKRKCYGYDINPDGDLVVNPDEARVVCWIFGSILLEIALGKLLVWKDRASLSPLAGPDGTGKRLTNCSPIKNTLGECCFKKLSALALSRSKTMASWNGISTPVSMRPLFLMRCLWLCNRKNSAAPKNLGNRLPWNGLSETTR